MTTFLLLLVSLIGTAFYVLPLLIAIKVNHRNKVGIIIVNIFLGWTFLGWIISLVWAVNKDKEQQVVIQNIQTQNSSIDDSRKEQT